MARLPFVAALGMLACAATGAHAQSGKFEITPQFGYTFGGSRDFDAFDVPGTAVRIPGGSAVIEDSPAYGVMLSFEGARNSFFTLTYMRQDTDLRLDFNSPPPEIPELPNLDDARIGFATNQFIAGFRQEFAKSSTQKLRFYLGGGLGFNVLDGKEEGLETSTYFLLTPHGGLRYMFGPAEERSRFGLQADIRGIFTFVPSGDVGIYCDYWGFCYAYEGTSTLSQGTVSLGAVLKF